MCLSSAWSITASVNPPRAVFVDFPLGRTAGRRGDRSVQRRIMIDALTALDSVQRPGAIIPLPYRWADSDDWKDAVMQPASSDAADDRRARDDRPQYQYPEDRDAAEGGR